MNIIPSYLGNEKNFFTTFKGAGKLYIKTGKIVHINNNTGHLKTSIQGLYAQREALIKSGLALENSSITIIPDSKKTPSND